MKVLSLFFKKEKPIFRDFKYAKNVEVIILVITQLIVKKDLQKSYRTINSLINT